MDRVIFWDYDGTIVHGNESFRDSLVKALFDNGYKITDIEAKEQLKQICSWYFPDKIFVERTDNLWWEDLLNNLSPLLDRKKVPTSMREKVLADFKNNAIHFPYEPYEGVADILFYCKTQGYKNFVISSNFPELDNIISKLGWGEYFDGYFLSSLVGYEKPRKELYEFAYVQVGKPISCYMIGDNPVADMKGAKNVGMCTVLVHKNGEKYPDTDYSVKNLEEIKEIIK